MGIIIIHDFPVCVKFQGYYNKVRSPLVGTKQRLQVMQKPSHNQCLINL